MRAFVFAEPTTRRDPAWLRLMSAIVTQAVRDCRSPDLARALDAALWLSSPEARTFLDAIGIDADPLGLLTSGQAKRVNLNVWTGGHGR